MTDTMLPRRGLGRTGLQVTPLGLAPAFVRTSRGRGLKLIAAEVEQAFHEYGINTFLVHSTMKEQCEGVRRLISAGHRDELVLISAVSLPFVGSTRRGLEKHLRLLGTEHLDVWLIGWLRGHWQARDVIWKEMTRLRDEGKTRAIGYSSHNRRLAADLGRELPADVLMIRYNAAHRGAEREIFDALADLGDRRPGIIAYTATRWGMLLKPLEKRGFPAAMSAPECYRFVLGHPMVDMAWCGAATLIEVREDVLGALAGPLDPARREQVCHFGDAVHAAAHGGWRWMFGSRSD